MATLRRQKVCDPSQVHEKQMLKRTRSWEAGEKHCNQEPTSFQPTFCILDCTTKKLKNWKRELTSRGWIQLDKKKKTDKLTEVIKYVDSDTCLFLSLEDLQSYDLLPPNVLYNHFEGNRALTTKEGLANTIQELSWTLSVDPDDFFPRCYSLSNSGQRKAFRDDFRRTAAQSIVRKIADGHFDNLSETSEEVVQLAILACRIRIRELNGECEGVDYGMLENNNPFKYSGKQLNENEWQKIEEFHNFNSRSPGKNLVAPEVERISFFGQELADEACQIVKKLSKIEPQWKMNGKNNIWIVKPSDRSKGVGISLHQNLDHILRAGKQMGSRIVQKYVENPMTVHSGLKFDIRVWVLVTSFEPLTIYVYSPFYCRVCQEKYSTESIELENIKAHLCNFSVRRKSFRQRERMPCEGWKSKSNVAVENYSSVLSQDELVAHLEGQGFNSKTIVQEIEKVCVLAIKSGENLVKHRDKSFELFGIDVLLDENAKPWLLEVNLSPGLCEKNKVQADLIRRMTKEMADIVLSVDSPCLNSTSTSNTGWKLYTKGMGSEELQCSRADAFLTSNKPTSGIRFLLQGRSTSKIQLDAIDNIFKLNNSLATLKRFIAVISREWQYIRAFRRIARLRIIRAMRSYVVRVKMFRIYQHRTAKRIQAFWKKSYALKKILKAVKLRMASKIQSYWRKVRDFHKAKLRRFKQKYFRRWNKQHIHFQHNLIRIQCFFRILAAMKVRNSLFTKRKIKEKKHQAAVMIQNMYYQRKEYLILKRKLAVLKRKQEALKRAQQRIHEKKIVRAAASRIIRNCWFRYILNKRFALRLQTRNASLIQRFVRNFLKRNNAQKVEKIWKSFQQCQYIIAASSIQQFFRASKFESEDKSSVDPTIINKSKIKKKKTPRKRKELACKLSIALKHQGKGSKVISKGGEKVITCEKLHPERPRKQTNKEDYERKEKLEKKNLRKKCRKSVVKSRANRWVHQKSKTKSRKNKESPEYCAMQTLWRNENRPNLEAFINKRM